MVDSPERQLPPNLPKRLTDLGPALVVGSAAWAAALITIIVLYTLGYDVGIWLTTTIAGLVLGAVGMSLVAWQRYASRKGRRGAQRGL
ncbi:DUF2530 domain-containing protein [Haloechinothrix sp. LS1_15]|uniref:DUF2530 domain-containing protein n=1 Tax=Haloechinothrix sp. LS1_15 TaxID=2652248 RepID=UPI0029487320|nr:DUF2530 domain-containing protein [Haloechinothrix sp. LS1_15]MDV6014368.1 DUF2530 domain-containing protein [Haloechinothrix sp. LS1_15]